MRPLFAIALLLPGCFWITDAEHAARIDQDGDGEIVLGYPGGTDCDDTNPDIRGADTWFADSDGDGFGDPESTIESCEAPTGYVSDASDCDDGDDQVHPNAVEICSDGKDNDCDGLPCLPGGDYELPLGPALSGVDVGSIPQLVLNARGDADGDGHAELLLGAPGSGGTGRVYLFSGPFAQDLDVEAAAAVLEGPGVTARAGASLAWLDADGDGQASLVVGAPGADLPLDGSGDPIVDGGAVFILDSAPSGEVALIDSPTRVDGEYTTAFGQPMEELRLGLHVVATPDLTEDGLNDLLIAAPGFDAGPTNRVHDAGAWFVLPGGSSGALLADDLGWYLHGTDVWQIGTGPLAIADFDGDGELQVMVTANPSQDADTGTPASGNTVFLSSPPSASDPEIEMDEFGLKVSGSEGETQDFGAALLVVDFNGDGGDDLIVSAPGELQSLGAVYVFYGGPGDRTVDAEADLILRGDAEGDAFGAAIDMGPDFDGDGHLELIIGAPGADGGGGRVYAFSEATTGAIDGGDATWTLLPGDEGPGLGASLGTGADLDGDSYQDLALGVTVEQEARVLIVAGGAL
ncbi:MAG: FG-GAP repeat protein [Alphaproteobacteria bacterium]|nr:FG-GAP repeat protein [Alphaproteobacteria bacterium]